MARFKRKRNSLNGAHVFRVLYTDRSVIQGIKEYFHLIVTSSFLFATMLCMLRNYMCCRTVNSLGCTWQLPLVSFYIVQGLGVPKLARN
jgi:hypothetical protein